MGVISCLRFEVLFVVEAVLPLNLIEPYQRAPGSSNIAFSDFDDLHLRLLTFKIRAAFDSS